MSTYRVFGDIEGNMEIFESIKRELNTNQCFIFLGDIFSIKNINSSIIIIKYLMNYFEFKIKEYFDDNTDSKIIKHKIHQLKSKKSIESYNPNYSQFWLSIPKENDSYDKKCIFLFGNKEIEFICEIIRSSSITVDNNKNVIINSKFFDKCSQNTKSSTMKITLHQLNVLYNYLNLCHHYYIYNNTIYIHCYFNFCKLRSNKDIKNIVCGHNKGYGKFYDHKFDNINIFMVDFTEYNKTIPENVSIIVNDKSIIIDYNNLRIPKKLYSLHIIK